MQSAAFYLLSLSDTVPNVCVFLKVALSEKEIKPITTLHRCWTAQTNTQESRSSALSESNPRLFRL